VSKGTHLVVRNHSDEFIAGKVWADDGSDFFDNSPLGKGDHAEASSGSGFNSTASACLGGRDSLGYVHVQCTNPALGAPFVNVWDGPPGASDNWLTDYETRFSEGDRKTFDIGRLRVVVERGSDSDHKEFVVTIVNKV
jgi:hypothetical protein